MSQKRQQEDMDFPIINQAAKARLGGFHSALSVMYSVDFAEIETMQNKGKCTEMAQILSRAARSLEAAITCPGDLQLA